jgi:nucleoside-diphosphate-sugar epimerase
MLHGRVSVFGGAQYRPLLHVRDVAEAVVPTLFTEHAGIFNLHSENVTIRELAERVKQIAPEVGVEYVEMKSQDTRNYRVSSEKASETFGFKPLLKIEDGVRQIADLVLQGRIRDTASPRYSNLDFLRPLLVPETSPLGTELVVTPALRLHSEQRADAT